MQFPDVVPTPMNLRFLRAKRVLDNAIERIIDERRKGVDKPDLLSMLMHIVDEETGEKMSDAQLRDEVMTIFVAGHETTANVLAWTLWLLSQHPQEEARLRAEIASLSTTDAPGGAPGHHGFSAKTEAIVRAPFLDAVIKESMRLFPPAWVLARHVENDEVVNGYPLRAGNFVFVSQYVVHRHPKL
jgi:cytochrome P450